jgi:hypothetical protein
MSLHHVADCEKSSAARSKQTGSGQQVTIESLLLFLYRSNPAHDAAVDGHAGSGHVTGTF